MLAGSCRAAKILRSYSAPASTWSEVSAVVREGWPSEGGWWAARAVEFERMLPAPPRPVDFA